MSLSKSLVGFAMVLMPLASAFATPVYNGTAQEKQTLEKAVKTSLRGSVKVVSCRHVISVATGGSRNSAIAGVCVLDGQESQLSCTDVMTGGSSSSVRLHPDQTLESELLSLIEQQCTGG